jgi:hypothetical protein
MANDTNQLLEYEALKAAREMAAQDTSAALERVANELAKQQRRQQQQRERSSARLLPVAAGS